MDRRKFLAQAAAITTSSFLSSALPFKLAAGSLSPSSQLTVWKGIDYYQGVKDAINAAGGIRQFVPEHSTVGVLVNSAFEFPGTLVNPDITISLFEILLETSPKEIAVLQVIDESYWELGAHHDNMKDCKPLVSQVATNSFPSEYNKEDFTTIKNIPGAEFLQDAEVVKKWLEADVFINIPIIKHHGLTLITGALKNMMGLCTRKTNVGFHLDSGVKNDPGYLGQCIADINLLRKPDLILADATKLIVNNGPSGPGDIVNPSTIIVGNDPVAVDSFGCQFLDLLPDDIHSIGCAYRAGLGEMNIDNLEIQEINP
jgi:uncharacterized protein (DUF362 family)